MTRFLCLCASISVFTFFPGPAATQETTAEGTDSTVTVIARPPEELRQAGLRYQGAVRTCYEREGLRQDPTLAGSIEVGLTILPQGNVADIAVDTLDVQGTGMREVVACVAAVAAGWHFSEGSFSTERGVLMFTFIAPAGDKGNTAHHHGAAGLPPAYP